MERELESHPNADASAQWAIELLASRRCTCYLRTTKSILIRIDRGAIRQAAKYDGKWVIETNDDTISLEDADAARLPRKYPSKIAQIYRHTLNGVGCVERLSAEFLRDIVCLQYENTSKCLL